FKSLWSNPEAFLRLNPPCFDGKKQERNRNTCLTGFRSLASGQTHPSLIRLLLGSGMLSALCLNLLPFLLFKRIW
ncbi:hypothetical protein, partial [Algoriphagus sp.]|uniref:hypothetical protein n=1 Tax=Algoriphagus sp. TaxID=1872435 RepID=UPI00272FB4C7